MPRLYSEPVGILIGQIIEDSYPLVIWIKQAPDGRHTTTVYESKDLFRDAFGTAIHLVSDLSPQVKRFWSSSGNPGWYYIQLNDGFPPDCLRNWSLPWTVYESWAKWGRR
jgi:hypothetical protein